MWPRWASSEGRGFVDGAWSCGGWSHRVWACGRGLKQLAREGMVCGEAGPQGFGLWEGSPGLDHMAWSLGRASKSPNTAPSGLQERSTLTPLPCLQ